MKLRFEKVNMLIIRRVLSISQSFSHFYRLVCNADRASNRIIYFNRFVSNPGCLIAGCCFSRQSDAEILLPKNNHDVSDSQTVYNSQPQLSIVQHATMKRICDSEDEISSQNAAVNSNKSIETCRKKTKTEDLKNDSALEVLSAINPTTSANENLGILTHFL